MFSSHGVQREREISNHIQQFSLSPLSSMDLNSILSPTLYHSLSTGNNSSGYLLQEEIQLRSLFQDLTYLLQIMANLVIISKYEY